MMAAAQFTYSVCIIKMHSRETQSDWTKEKAIAQYIIKTWLLLQLTEEQNKVELSRCSNWDKIAVQSFPTLRRLYDKKTNKEVHMSSPFTLHVFKLGLCYVRAFPHYHLGRTPALNNTHKMEARFVPHHSVTHTQMTAS